MPFKSITSWFSGNPNKEAYSSITLVEAESFLEVSEKKNAILIDVRTTREFKRDALPNAIHINFFDRKFTSRFEIFSKEQPICLYCAIGWRSGSAARKLARKGFTEVYDLKNGLKGWD